jgi:beta-N-acetylhexosaminidase
MRSWRVGEALAKEVRAMNFDVDFAPVLDVDTNPKNPIIGDRSFSRDPKMVGKLGAALIKGLQKSGVGACAKHFPGHGDTDVDSHHDLPLVKHDLDRLRHTEWPPFLEAIRAGVSAVMTAHVVVEALDTLPSTLSKRVLTQHLREELGFSGVIVSDDIEMKAVADRFSPEEMAKLGLQAGIDVFLACHKPEVTLALYRGIIRAVEDEHVSHDTIMRASKRALAWRKKYYQPAVDSKVHAAHIGSHSGLVEEILSKATA